MVFQFQKPARRELLGGDLLAQSLKHLGCDVAFGLHGGHLDAFLVGAEEAGIRLIDTRHETVGVQAAEGYAKVCGKVGVCFVTANSGFANGLPGLASAYADRSPVFCITSSPPLRDAETNALQGFHDQVVLSQATTKFSHRVTNVEEIPRLAAYAYRSAMSGIPGPVLLDVPIDVLFSPPQMNGIAYGAVDVPPAYPPAPAPESLKKLADLWIAAKRPVIITGTGTRGTGGRLFQLAEKFATPVFYSNKYSTDLPHGHDLRAGSATLLAKLAAAGGAQPDFVLIIGARTGFLLGGRSGGIIPNKGCKLAQVDLDGAEIGKTLPINLGIVSDATLFVDSFMATVASDSAATPSDWVKTCASLRKGSSPFEKDDKVMPDGRLHPYHAAKELMRTLPRDSIIVIDGGECGQWTFNAVEEAEPHICMVSTGYLGMLGNGWGYALGASVADPSRLVVSIHGDGSLGFHIGELDTFARFGLKIMTVVFNNAVWGMSINGQDLVYEGKSEARPATRLSSTTAYDAIAEGFGCRGKKVDKLTDLPAAVKDCSHGPSLINLIVSGKPTTPATKSMVNAVDDPNVIVVPYYDNVPRPHYRQSNGTAANGH